MHDVFLSSVSKIVFRINIMTLSMPSFYLVAYGKTLSIATKQTKASGVRVYHITPEQFSLTSNKNKF